MYVYLDLAPWDFIAIDFYFLYFHFVYINLQNFTNIILPILAPPAIEKKGLKKVYFVKEADSVTIKCPVKGYPAPVITWLKDSDVIPLHSSPHINFSDGFQNLQLLHASLKDAGTYTCIAGNEIGTDEMDFKLDVQGNHSFVVSF